MAGAVAFRQMKDGPDMLGEGSSVVGSTGQKTESKKHPSLPKEVSSGIEGLESLQTHSLSFFLSFYGLSELLLIP